MKKNPYALAMIVALVSLLGFLVENLWLFLVSGQMNNRGMVLPFLLGHGLIFVALYQLFGLPSEPRLFKKQFPLKALWARILLYLLIVTVCISLGEILVGTFVEWAFHFRWWDYSGVPLHLTRYTSLPTSIALAAIITVLMQLAFLPLYRFFLSWKARPLRRTALILFILMAADFVFAGIWMFTHHGTLVLWTIDASGTGLYRLLHP